MKIKSKSREYIPGGGITKLGSHKKKVYIEMWTLLCGCMYMYLCQSILTFGQDAEFLIGVNLVLFTILHFFGENFPQSEITP